MIPWRAIKKWANHFGKINRLIFCLLWCLLWHMGPSSIHQIIVFQDPSDSFACSSDLTGHWGRSFEAFMVTACQLTANPRSLLSKMNLGSLASISFSWEGGPSVIEKESLWNSNMPVTDWPRRNPQPVTTPMLGPSFQMLLHTPPYCWNMLLHRIVITHSIVLPHWWFWGMRHHYY